MRAFITGITGFAGGHLTRHLVAAGDDVLGASRSGDWSTSRLLNPPQDVPVVRWDIGRADGLPDEARERIEAFAPECIYHLAAVSVPEDCGRDRPTAAAVSVNIDGTERVLELAAALARPCRVLCISTSRVYRSMDAATPPLSETAPLGPTTPYGQTKRAAEEAAERAIAAGLDALIIRAFHHAGPGQDQRLMLSSWAREFALGGTHPVEIRCRGVAIDLTDVRDTVRAYRLLAERGSSGSVYNVGTGTATTTGAIFDVLHNLADPSRAVVELRPETRFDPIADIARLVKATSWQPSIPLETTVADSLDDWRRRVASSRSRA